jgi:hypothetical protein
MLSNEITLIEDGSEGETIVMTEFESSTSSTSPTIGNQLNTQEFIFTIWKNRNNYNVVNDTVQQFSNYVNELKIYKEIEFFLPQIAHLIIHLVFDGDMVSPLESFCLLICDISLHMTMNMNFLLLGAAIYLSNLYLFI